MTKARLDGLYLMLLGTVVFLSFGILMTVISPSSMNDFRQSYYGVRTMLQGGDPYSQPDVLRVYSEAHEARMRDEHSRATITLNIYPPTEFLLLLPFAALPFAMSQVLWISLVIATFLLASFLIWDISSNYDPVISGLLIGCVLANSQLLIFTGNPAGIAMSLCIIAAWCFLADRFVLAGVICLAMSLALKPHDAGPVWLFMVLIGGTHRKRALQALALLVACSIPILVAVQRLSPHWIYEWMPHVRETFARGGINDPGPASTSGQGLAMMTNLQTVFAVFWDNPHFYNLMTYLVCGPLLAIWIWKVLRSRFTTNNAWLALAAIFPLALAGVYHRQYDASLLLFAVPVVVILRSKGSRFARQALGVLLAGIILTGDLTWSFLAPFIRHLYDGATLPRRFTAALGVVPVPITLLAVGLFFLWLYIRHPFTEVDESISSR